MIANEPINITGTGLTVACMLDDLGSALSHLAIGNRDLLLDQCTLTIVAPIGLAQLVCALVQEAGLQLQFKLLGRGWSWKLIAVDVIKETVTLFRINNDG